MYELDLEGIKKIIPHRDPFLLVDKVSVIEDGKKVIGYKLLTGNEDFFKGHFPGNPIMPGVLILESMAQTSCVLFLSKPEVKDKLAYFMTIDKTKFRRPAYPGDEIRLEIEVLHTSGNRAGRVRGTAYVKDTKIAESEFMFALVDREKK